MRKTLKFRLSLIISTLLALATAAGGAYIIHKASDDTRAEVRSALNLADHFIDAEVAVMRDRWYARGFTPPLFHLQELQDVRHLSVTFYGVDGRTLDSNTDSDNPNPLAPDWFTWLVRRTSAPMQSHIRRENHRRTRRMIEVQEEERKSLARELHDEIGQCVTAIHADAAAIRNRGSPEVLESARAIMTVTTDIKAMVRRMLQRLRPPVLDGLGLEAALQELTESFRQCHPTVRCDFASAPSLRELEGEVAVAIYRVVQECLTNIAAHASARRVTIRIDSAATGQIDLTVADDGVGFFTVASKQGYGLTGIRERVTVLGGSCEIDSNPGRGTRVHVEVPLPMRLGQAA